MREYTEEECTQYINGFLEHGQYDAGEIMLSHILANDGIDLLTSLEEYASNDSEFGDWFNAIPERLQILYDSAWREAGKKYDMPNLPQMTYGLMMAWVKHQENITND